MSLSDIFYYFVKNKATYTWLESEDKRKIT